MHPVLKWFLILALIAAAAVIAIKAFYTEPATAQALQTDPPEPHPSTVPSSTKTREAAPTATPFQRRPAEGLLVLINWEHPLTCEVRPADLVPLESVFSQDLVTIDNDDGSVNATAGAAARDMFQAARENGIGRYLITSAYRCVSYQEAFYQEALSEDPSYGDDPYNNPVRVLPGNCTEHTTGLAIDILSEAYRDADDGYADTAEGKWLAENAHKFGFILRYPRNKQHLTGVIFEPWHYRYVGVEAATEIYELGLCLEEYVYMPL